MVHIRTVYLGIYYALAQYTNIGQVSPVQNLVISSLVIICKFCGTNHMQYYLLFLCSI